jgi:hypothetical protein
MPLEFLSFFEASPVEEEVAQGHGLTPVSQDYAATAAVMFDRQRISHSHHREA